MTPEPKPIPLDGHDIATLGLRMDIIERTHSWIGSRLDPEILQAALNVVPIGEETGWVVVWLPYAEGDYEARWCLSRLSVLWVMGKARRQRSLMSFVFDLRQIVDEVFSS